LDLGEWSAGAQTALSLAAVALGCFAIGFAAWVWLRWQVFGFAGAALCGSGALLLSLSLWRSLALGASHEASSRLQASLDRIAKLATDQTESVSGIRSELLLEKQALKDLAAQAEALQSKCDPSRRASAGSFRASGAGLEERPDAKLSALLDKVRYSLMMGDPKEAMRNLQLLETGMRSAETSFRKNKNAFAEPVDFRAVGREIDDVMDSLRKYLVQGYKAEPFHSLEYNIFQRTLDDVEHAIATLEAARMKMSPGPAADPG